MPYDALRCLTMPYDASGRCAIYLGLGRAAASAVGDQLGALSVLRDFAIDLAKCAAENEARDAETAKEAAKAKEVAAKEAGRLARLAAHDAVSEAASEAARDTSSPDDKAGSTTRHDKVDSTAESGVVGPPTASSMQSVSRQSVSPTAAGSAAADAVMTTPIMPSPARSYNQEEYF